MHSSLISDDVARWLSEPDDADIERRGRMAEAYMLGEDNNLDRWDTTRERMDAWLARLSPEERALLDAQRAENRQQSDAYRMAADTIRGGLETTATSLLDGRLPEDQEAALRQELGEDYASLRYMLGSNQSGPTTVEAAEEYLRAGNGIDLTWSNLDSRFLFAEQRPQPGEEAPSYDFNQNITRVMVNGHYGVHGSGKFIIAVPIPDHADITDYGVDTAPDALYRTGELPEDYILLGSDDQKSVNTRYVAGFVDTHGRYHRLPGFMQRAAAEPSNN
ncbi:MAG TPA: hypothetical protein VLF91_01490 [Candidatus Saccharimonadales bacterium]|nr:hypothetical protein [Candidatus Saccharimonadales bacterium]